MNSKLSLAFITIFALTLGFVFLPAKAQDEVADAPAPNEAKAAMKWQHLALTHDSREFGGNAKLARQINQLGEEGWEMFNVLNFQNDGTTTKTIYHFKRPL